MLWVGPINAGSLQEKCCVVVKNIAQIQECIPVRCARPLTASRSTGGGVVCMLGGDMHARGGVCMPGEAHSCPEAVCMPRGLESACPMACMLGSGGCMGYTAPYGQNS